MPVALLEEHLVDSLLEVGGLFAAPERPQYGCCDNVAQEVLGAEEIDGRDYYDGSNLSESWVVPLEDEMVDLPPVVPVLPDEPQPRHHLEHLCKAYVPRVRVLVLDHRVVGTISDGSERLCQVRKSHLEMRDALAWLGRSQAKLPVIEALIQRELHGHRPRFGDHRRKVRIDVRQWQRELRDHSFLAALVPERLEPDLPLDQDVEVETLEVIVYWEAESLPEAVRRIAALLNHIGLKLVRVAGQPHEDALGLPIEVAQGLDLDKEFSLRISILVGEGVGP